MNVKLFQGAALGVSFLSCSAVSAATLSIPSGDQVLISNLDYQWASTAHGPGLGNTFEFDSINVVQDFNGSDGSTYGVSAASDLQALYAGDSIMITKGPGFGTVPFEVEGHATLPGDSFDYEMRVGTGSDLGATQHYEPWIIQIDAGANESNGQPAIVRVTSSIAGTISGDDNAYSQATWTVVVDGVPLQNRMLVIATGSTDFSDDDSIDIATTIGSSVALQADGIMIGDGAVAVFGDPAVDIQCRFTKFDFTVTLMIPACDADLNADGIVDTADLGVLIGVFGANAPAADINGDGIVDTADLGILLGSFGQGCGMNAP
ncbi:MAG: hypothetical protein H6813_06025 [Phycisphaeraceae bacterium]|nr:hypothetical protein [Phycisphaeraceae bacterium]MCB9848027.1 hypothetical protein [Phycisphaeraceae bacterium]